MTVMASYRLAHPVPHSYTVVSSLVGRLTPVEGSGGEDRTAPLGMVP